MTAVLLISFVLLLLMNVPIAFCMLISFLLALLYADINPIILALETTRSMTNFYSFLAVPFFILAGEIMGVGGLSARLVELVKVFIGHKRNGLPFVAVVSSQLFGAISGASAATCAAIGSMMVPAMENNGYNRSFSSALVACSGTTGALIPPSIALLLYGTIANVSIEKLFIGGIVPGILIGLGIIIVTMCMTRKFDIKVEKRASWSIRLKTSFYSFWVILLMAIIFGGIMGGLFTATEASAVAVVYSLFVSMVIYRKIGIRDLPGVFIAASKTAASLSFLIACASLFAWTLSVGQIPSIISNAMIASSDGIINIFASDLSPESYMFWRKIVILFMLNIVLFIISMFIDVAPGLLIVVPVLLPISEAIGMSTGLAAVHFGVLVVSNMIIGLITPPVGTTLFVASGVGKVNVNEMLPYVLRFFVVMVIVQLMITYIPIVSTGLPSLMVK